MGPGQNSVAIVILGSAKVPDKDLKCGLEPLFMKQLGDLVKLFRCHS